MIVRTFVLISIMMTVQPTVLYQFSKESDSSDWIIVDDVVMGGRSAGKFYVNEDGKGVFEGRVSLENNGGFSSVRHRLNKEGVTQYSMLVLRVKGDGKRYQFRIKDRLSNYYSYIANFTSPTTWQVIKIPLNDMYPAFRGRRLNSSNFESDSIEEIAFLIGNKKAENFKLEIDFVGLE